MRWMNGVRPRRWGAEMAADVRYAMRGLRRSPGFTATAVLTLALGIGASSAVFSAVNTVLLAPLPYPNPERLVRIYHQNSGFDRGTLSAADWQGIREQQRSFESVALFRTGGAALTTREGAEWVKVGWGTAGLFRTLGVRMARGAGFREGDDRTGAPLKVVVGEEFARRHFGGADPIGRPLVLDRVSYTVAGVLPPGVRELAGVQAEVWPILQPPVPTRRGPFGLHGIGRLRPGVTREAAARELAGISARVVAQWANGAPDRSVRYTPVPLRDVLLGDAGRSLRLFGGAVFLVLLIAIANVANLVLVRASGRGREIAVRTALGAARERLARMLLTESLVLGGLGGLAGVAVAALGLKALATVGPRLPRIEEASLDLRVMAFSVAAGLLSGALVGTYPLVAGMSRSIAASLRSGDRGAGAGRGTQLFQGALVAGEFALALPLLLGAGLLLHSFVNLQRVDPGFDPDRVLTARISLPEAAYAEPAEMLRFWDEALRSVKELPGVEEAGLTTSLPPDNGGDSNNFDLVERPVAPGESEPSVPWALVTPELFGALGVPLVDGRMLERRDDSPDRPVVVVSRSWARRYFPGESAVGKRMYVGGCRECPPSTVVGVVGDVKYSGLAEGAESVYEPVRQNPGSTLSLVVRASVSPESLAEPIRQRIRAVDPGVPVRDFATMGERLSTSIASPRSLAWLLGAFAAAALVMAALGVFGVMSYAVAQQRREIAVRIALGADAPRVVRMVMRRGMVRAAAGLAVGAVVSIGAMRAVEAMLFEVRTTDPATMAIATALLLGVAVVACWVPGWRAARIDPARAMAAE